MKNIEIGDLLKSNPLKGFWVCSIVLSYQPKSDAFSAMSHVAMTNAVFDHDFSLSEIDRDNLKIIYSTNNENIVIPCIEMHASKLVKGIEVVGRIETGSHYPHVLQFKIGNGSDGGWPQCGPLSKSLGYQAVHHWREINDREAWLNDISEAEKSHAAMLERIKHG